MKNRIRSGVSAVLGLLALGLLLPAGASAQAVPAVETAAAAAPAACQLVFEPAAVAAGGPAQELEVTLALSETAELDPAQVGRLSAPDESGLELARVEGDAFLIAVDPTAAKAGQWEIEAYGAAGGAEPADPLCVGSLQVQ